ncbi:MAG: NAD-dependent protein deacylase [Promethearchaeota archaeon]
MSSDAKKAIKKASELIKNAKHITAFTGAGISVESGIPPFRGKGGLWEKYDPSLFHIEYFRRNPKASWELIKEIFFQSFGITEPNTAHKVIAKLEEEYNLKAVITQNIDNLHQAAGSKYVIQFHGNSNYIICMQCNHRITFNELDFNQMEIPPKCQNCGGLLKPDFVFFGEPIPQNAYTNSIIEAETADLFILVGTTGIVMPAALIPFFAKQNGAKIIEVNPNPSQFTNEIVDIFINLKAKEAFSLLANELNIKIEE